MENDNDYWTLRAMRIYGGSFVQQLAVLAGLADSQNLRRIQEAWKEYWEKYETWGKELKAGSKEL